MATAITTSGTTLEAQVLETISALSEEEKALSTPINNVTIAPDLENNTVTLSVSLPIAIDVSSGDIVLASVEYAV